jgi:hypothetical protein
MKIDYGKPQEVIKKEIVYPDKKYIAFDGKEFSVESDCSKYENELKQKLENVFYKKYTTGKEIYLDSTEEYYKVITFKDQEELNSLYGFSRGYVSIGVVGYCVNDMRNYPTVLKGISFPATFLATYSEWDDGCDYTLIPIEETKKNLESDLAKIKEFC